MHPEHGLDIFEHRLVLPSGVVSVRTTWSPAKVPSVQIPKSGKITLFLVGLINSVTRLFYYKTV